MFLFALSRRVFVNNLLLRPLGVRLGFLFALSRRVFVNRQTSDRHTAHRAVSIRFVAKGLRQRTLGAALQSGEMVSIRFVAKGLRQPDSRAVME